MNVPCLTKSAMRAARQFSQACVRVELSNSNPYDTAMSDAPPVFLQGFSPRVKGLPRAPKFGRRNSLGSND